MSRTVFSISSLWMLGILAACHMHAGESSIPYYNEPDFEPHFFSAAQAETAIDHRIAAFTMTNQHGDTITESAIDGKIQVASFIFTSCGSICPVMVKHMKLLQQQFANDTGVVMLSFSVTPWIDSVQRLKRFAVNNNITAANWHLLTGSQSEIYRLARQSYFAEEDIGFTKDSSEFLHTEHILLVDGKRRIRGIFNGTLLLEIEQLAQDIEALKREQ